MSAELELKTVAVEKPEELNLILGQAHFVKTVEDLYETLAGSSPHLRFGLAFCESSGPMLVRRAGNDEELVELAVRNALAIGAGHSFVVFLREGHPVNVLNQVKAVPEVCRVYCATANPVEVVVGETPQGRAILGVATAGRPAASRAKTTCPRAASCCGRSAASSEPGCDRRLPGAGHGGSRRGGGRPPGRRPARTTCTRPRRRRGPRAGRDRRPRRPRHEGARPCPSALPAPPRRRASHRQRSPSEGPRSSTRPWRARRRRPARCCRRGRAVRAHDAGGGRAAWPPSWPCRQRSRPAPP